MIFNSSEYNPLPAILDLVPVDEDDLYLSLMSDIRKELFKGGTVCESDEEILKCIKVLSELGVVSLTVTERSTYKIKKGPYGQSTQ